MVNQERFEKMDVERVKIENAGKVLELMDRFFKESKVKQLAYEVLEQSLKKIKEI